VDLGNELLRLVKEKNPELGPEKIQGATAIDKLAYLVENRKEYGKMLDDAFEMIESAYLKDPTKYPAEFMAEVHKYLNTVAETRTGRLRSVISQAVKETGLSLKDMVLDWNKTGRKKLQSFLTYVKDKTSLSDSDAKVLVDEVEKEMKVVLEEKREQLAKEMFADAPKKKQKDLQRKLIESVNLGVVTDARYRDLWAEKMGIKNFTEEQAIDLTKSLKEIDSINPDKMYDVEGVQTEGWKIQKKLWDDYVKRMSKDIPASATDKWLKITHFGMLSNPASWAKNPLSNIGMQMMDDLSNIPEAMLQKSRPQSERTTTLENWKKDPDRVKKVAEWWERYALPEIKRTGMDMSMTTLANQNKRTFSNDTAEAISNIPINVMEFGDIGFLKRGYENALGRYMTARGLKEPTAQAHEFAKNKALELTFRDKSEIAKAIIDLKNGTKLRREADRWAKIAETSKDPQEAQFANTQEKKYRRFATLSRIAGQAVMPYVNTPVNIARRAKEYSPFELISAVTKWKDGDINGVYKSLSTAGVGTLGAMGMGIVGALSGVLTAGYPKDADEQKYWKSQGITPYSVKLGNKWVSLDWMAPMVVPLMMGAATIQERNPLEGVKVFEDMSFIRSLNQLVGGQGSASEKALSVALDAPLQAMPNLMKKIAYSVDPIIRDTYDPSAVQSSLNRILTGVPGASMSLEAKYDIWGRPLKAQQYIKDSDTPVAAFERLIKNVMIPWRTSRQSTEPETVLVGRIFKAAQEAGDDNADSVLPNFSGTKEIGGEKMTAEEYAQYQSVAGQYALKEVRKLLSSSAPDYSETGDSKFKQIQTIYSDAARYAKSQIQGTKFTPTTRTLSNNGKDIAITESEYNKYREKYDAYKAKGYTNASALAKYDILKGKGIQITKPTPQEEK